VADVAARMLHMKRSAFRFEREVRVVWIDRYPDADARFVEFDAPLVVEQIMIGPSVQSATKTYLPVEKTGQTAMGVKMKYTEYRNESWGVALLNVPAKTGQVLGSIKLQMSADDAKNLVPRLVWRIQGTTLATGLSGLHRGVANRDWPLHDHNIKEATLDNTASYFFTALFAPAVAKSITLMDTRDGEVYGTVEVK
jgi:hypothetical protein